MRAVLLSICLLVTLAAAPAMANEGGATYQRSRHGARGGHQGGGFYGQAYGGYGGWGFPGYYQPPTVFGSWYQRPYPTHLDFFRLRQRTPQYTPQFDCPHCAVPAVPFPAE